MLKPSEITAIVDSREQSPLELKLHCGTILNSVSGSLPTGDYSVKGLEDEIAIERKSLNDLVSCCTGQRERFEKQLQRLLSYRSRAVIVEANWDHIEMRAYRGRTSPNVIIGTILKWELRGVPFVMAGDRRRAGEFLARMLFGAARTRHKAFKEMFKSS